MRINRKLLKKKGRPKTTVSTSYRTNYKNGVQFNFDNVIGFSIIITFTSDRVSSLHNCLHYMNKCDSISKCELVLVLYQNEYVEHDFSQYKNINYKIIHSKRNNPKDIFCLSHARNIGLVNSTHDWILMLDGDIMIPPDTCKVLSHPKMRNNSHIYFTDRVNILSHRNFADLNNLYTEKIDIDRNFIGFFHFFNKKRIMDSVGGYDEEMIGWGREDCDLVTRAQRMGIHVLPVRNHIVVFHIPHGYNEDWKYNGSDEHNHNLQDYNLNNNVIKKHNIGIILK